MQYETLHEQVTLIDLNITCDKQIADVIQALNQVPGVATTASCWDVLNHGGGYVVIRTGNQDFLKCLEEAGYKPDSSKGKIQINIDPIQVKGLERSAQLDKGWKSFLGIVLEYNAAD